MLTTLKTDTETIVTQCGLYQFKMAFIRINSCRINITTVCCKIYFMTGALFLIFTVVPSNLRITSLVREAHFYYSFIRQIRDENL